MYGICVFDVTHSVFIITVETSMIAGVYVKSYLMPDKKKETKRKTEVLHVYKKYPNTDSTTDKSGVFQPETYTFMKALEYQKFNKDMIAERTVHIEVCIMQKYTFRSFVIATWNMPLKMAVRKLVKEKYPLTPRISTGLPENMKVYSADKLSVSYSNRAYNSNPNLRAPSVSSLYASPADRSSSDSDLKKVTVRPVEERVPSIEITVPSEADDEELSNALEQIAIMEMSELSPTSSVVMSDANNLQCDVAGSYIKGQHDDLAGQGLHEVMVHGQSQSDDVKVNMQKKGSKKKQRFSLTRKKDKDKVLMSHDVEIEMEDYDDNIQQTGDLKERSTSDTQKKRDRLSLTETSTRDTQKKRERLSLTETSTKDTEKKRDRLSLTETSSWKLQKKEEKLSVAETSLSRPETPTWDDYSEPMSFDTIMYPIDFEFDDAQYDAKETNLPMHTCLEMARVHQHISSVKPTSNTQTKSQLGSTVPVLAAHAIEAITKSSLSTKSAFSSKSVSSNFTVLSKSPSAKVVSSTSDSTEVLIRPEICLRYEDDTVGATNPGFELQELGSSLRHFRVPRAAKGTDRDELGSPLRHSEVPRAAKVTDQDQLGSPLRHSEVRRAAKSTDQDELGSPLRHSEVLSAAKGTDQDELGSPLRHTKVPRAAKVTDQDQLGSPLRHTKVPSLRYEHDVGATNLGFELQELGTSLRPSQRNDEVARAAKATGQDQLRPSLRHSEVARAAKVTGMDQPLIRHSEVARALKWESKERVKQKKSTTSHYDMPTSGLYMNYKL